VRVRRSASERLRSPTAKKSACTVRDSRTCSAYAPIGGLPTRGDTTVQVCGLRAAVGKGGIGGSRIRLRRAVMFARRWLAYACGSRRAARCRLQSVRLAALGAGREAGSPRSVSRSIRGRSYGWISWWPSGTYRPPRAPGRSYGPHGRSLGERPQRAATPPPAPYLECREGRDPEGSCAGAPLRAWLQQRRLRSPAPCVGTRSRRLRVCAEDRVARRFARGGPVGARGDTAW
jgi:hypothetical protein